MPRRSSNAKVQDGSNVVPRSSLESRRIVEGPTHEEIAVRAYEFFLARGGAHGRHEEDWCRAEQELRESRQAEATN